MWKMVLLLLNFVFWILLISSAFSGIKFWQWMTNSWLKDYYNSMSDKDVAFSMGYVIYRNYMQQLRSLSISTNSVITKIDYSNLKAQLAKMPTNLVTPQEIKSTNIIEKQKHLELPKHLILPKHIK